MTDLELLVDGEPETLRSSRGTCAFRGRTLSFELADLGAGDYSVLLGGSQYTVHVARSEGRRFQATVNGSALAVEVVDPRSHSARQADAADSSARDVRAPMPGKVLAVLVTAGDRVRAEQGLVVVEAMKMQNEIKSPQDGIVAEIAVEEGQAVEARDRLFVIQNRD